MSKKQVSFRANRVVKKPIKVQFKTKDGKTVSFKATRTEVKKVPVKFKVSNEKKSKRR